MNEANAEVVARCAANARRGDGQSGARVRKCVQGTHACLAWPRMVGNRGLRRGRVAPCRMLQGYQPFPRVFFGNLRGCNAAALLYKQLFESIQLMEGFKTGSRDQRTSWVMGFARATLGRRR